MIELIFAIVVVAIVMLSIPMIIRVMNQSQELSVGQEMFAKMYAQAQKKSMNPWDRHVSDIVLNPDDTNGTILWVSAGSVDLNCSRKVGSTFFRDNNMSVRACNQAGLPASAIPGHDGNVSGMWGIEQYNDEDIAVTDPIDGNYSAHIVVGYVDDSAAESSSGHLNTTWVLGNDTTPSGTAAASSATHLKRVVMTFAKTGKPTSTFTFFMSNIGVVQ
jgi:hypothetical protein